MGAHTRSDQKVPGISLNKFVFNSWKLQNCNLFKVLSSGGNTLRCRKALWKSSFGMPLSFSGDFFFLISIVKPFILLWAFSFLRTKRDVCWGRIRWIEREAEEWLCVQLIASEERRMRGPSSWWHSHPLSRIIICHWKKTYNIEVVYVCL